MVREGGKHGPIGDIAGGLCPFSGHSLIRPWARNAAAQCHLCGEFWMTLSGFRFAHRKRLELAPKHLAELRRRGRGAQGRPIHREDLEEVLKKKATR